MFRRDKDTRRTANSIRTHQKTMEAFGRAAGGWERVSENQAVIYDYKNPAIDGGPGVPSLADLSDGRNARKLWKPRTNGRGHVITSDGRIGTRGVSEFSRPTALNKKKLASRSEYYKDVHGFDPADDYKAPKKGKK